MQIKGREARGQILALSPCPAITVPSDEHFLQEQCNRYHLLFLFNRDYPLTISMSKAGMNSCRKILLFPPQKKPTSPTTIKSDFPGYSILTKTAHVLGWGQNKVSKNNLADPSSERKHQEKFYMLTGSPTEVKIELKTKETSPKVCHFAHI